MTATETRSLVVHREPRGLMLRGPYNAATHALVGTLPAKWSVDDRGWIVEPTPCAAARLLQAGANNNDDEADDAVDALAWSVEARRFLPANLVQPVLRVYDAWPHQLRAYHYADAADAALLAVCLGGGKSKVVCDLAWNRRWNRVLILAPLSVLGVWRREFERHAGGEFTVVILGQDGTSRKAIALDQALRRSRVSGESIVAVVNYESAWRGALGPLLQTTTWDAVVADESHKLKSPTGRAAKFAATLRRNSGMRLCLTGTPMPHSPGDLFSQFRFLDPGVFGVAWTRFRQRFAVCANPAIPQMVTSWINQEEFAELASLLMLRIDRDEAALGLPEVIHQDVPVFLGSQARRLYEELERESIAEIENGTITAANALVELLRLRQITSGVVGDDAKTLHRIDDAKRNALADLIDGLPGPPHAEPLVVFCQFRPDLAAVREVSEDLGRRYGEISGSRKDLTEHSTMPDDVDVMAVQWQAGSVGIDLTRACYAVIYSPTYNGGEFEQGLARVHRPGQDRPVTYYHLVASSTVDEAVYRALQRKAEIVETVLNYLQKGGER